MGRTYYIFSSGDLRRRENTIVFENEKGRKAVPIEGVEDIYIFGEVSLNTKLIGLLNSYGITLHFFNYYGWYMGSYYPRERNVSGFLTVKQVEHYTDPEKRLYLAKAFVEGAVRNLSRVFPGLDAAGTLKALEEARSVEGVMAVEANFRKAYYSKLADRTGWEFGRREKRPPTNPLNALISFGNSLVYTTVLKEIYTTPLLPTVSYLHEPTSRRFSLSLDVSEVFKPILSDRLILRLIDRGQIREEHFTRELNFAYLSEEGRRIYVGEYDKALRTTFRHRRLRRKISVRTAVRLELYKLIKHLLGEKPYRPFTHSSP